MNGEAEYPKTLVNAVAYFADEDAAHAFMVKLRWPDEGNGASAVEVH